MTTAADLTDRDFAGFRRFIYEAAGISLSANKKALVAGRLSRRVADTQMRSYREYLEHLENGEDQAEIQMAVNLLTTNETYFFREPKHFEVLKEAATASLGRGAPFRVWSAASSTGEEAYSIAMVLAERLGNRPWEIVGTDINSRVLRSAERAHYTMDRARHVPPNYLKRFCLRGSGIHEGTLLIQQDLRARVRFCHANLNDTLPDIGKFDVAFLRNVLIYFDDPTKRSVVERVAAQIRPGGYLFVGHSESLHGISDVVRGVAASIYRKPEL